MERSEIPVGKFELDLAIVARVSVGLRSKERPRRPIWSWLDVSWTPNRYQNWLDYHPPVMSGKSA